MSYRVSEKRKKKEKRGTGHGASYKPYIMPRELHGLSTTTAFYDPISGRQISLLSTGEKEAYLILRWQDDVVDIREQFPLEVEKTLWIASHYSIRHPADPRTGDAYTMTSDLLVDYIDGYQEVFSVKYSRSDLNSRAKEKLFIEKKYWEMLDIPFTMVFREDINKIYARNIRHVLKFYPASEVHDKKSLILHAIAHKAIPIDMTIDPLPVRELVDIYLPEQMNLDDITRILKERSDPN